MSTLLAPPQEVLQLERAISAAELREKLELLGYIEPALLNVHERHFGRRVTRLEELTREELDHWLNVMDFGIRRGGAGV